jgi:simple sugar transport system ATP-binding protein
MPPLLLEVHHLTKNFGVTRALAGVSFTLAAGEIHALLGENGAGKSTLVNLLYGLLRPDSGTIILEGKPFTPHSPAEAIRAGLGMIHQHFMLVPDFTVLENFMLGNARFDFSRGGMRRLREEVDKLCAQTGLHLDVSRRVAELSVGEQQRVEILKVLLRKCRLLILDEPTAVLTPAEAEELFVLLRLLRARLYGIVFISHKLEEVKAVSDRITVLRAGKVSGEFVTAQASVTAIARAITPDEAPPPPHAAPTDSRVMVKAEALHARGSTVASSIKGISFEIHAGEILAVAGVDGNGQAELAEALVGTRPLQSGRLWLADEEMTHAPAKVRFQYGLAHIPADRKVMGLFPTLAVYQNAAAFMHRLPPFQKNGWLRLPRLRAWSRELIDRFEVRTPGLDALMATLSGGNQQKMLVARELVRQPRFLVAVNPTRGVDLATTGRIHQMLRAERARGAAVLLISTELSEIFALADRLAVIFHGRIAGPFPSTVSRARVSALMLGASFPEATP